MKTCSGAPLRPPLGPLQQEVACTRTPCVVASLLLLATYPAEVLVFLTLVYLGMIPFAWRLHSAFERADAQRVAQEKALSAGQGPENSSGAA